MIDKRAFKGGRNLQKSKILVVEDEPDVLRIIEKHLVQEGHRVIAVSTLNDAMNVLWETPPDLILLDVMLPDGSGFEFCSKIKKITTAPIIFLTCMADTSDILKGFKIGADDYITKPFNLDILSARVASRLRQSGSYRNGVIELPPLYINLQTGRVTLKGKEIMLSQKELQLLALFADNAGREFSAEEIYHAIWRENKIASINTVRVHISNLRSKLQLDQASSFEITLTPSKGYMFIKTIFEAEW